MAVDAVMRLKANASSLDLIHILKKPGGCLRDSYLDDGFILEKKIGTHTFSYMYNAQICA